MLTEAIYHQPMSNYCYAYDEDNVHIRIRTAIKDFTEIKVFYKDKFDWTQHGCVTMQQELSDGEFDYYIARVPMIKRLTYYFLLRANDAEIYFTQSGVREQADDKLSFQFCFQYPYIYASDIHRPPAWVKDTVFYEIFVDRFCAVPMPIRKKVEVWGEKPTYDNHFGGNLEGICSRLDYLRNLGITGIYFTPIFRSDSNHKYDTIDFHEIDPEFGDLETLKRLVCSCHDRGIRVVLDGVFNHCSYKMEQFQDVLEKGERSEYFAWFCYKDNGLCFEKRGYETYSVTEDMPKLDTSNEEVQEYLLSIAEYWTRHTDIDGWRLDVGDELCQDFIRKLRKRLKSLKPDIYIVGECWYNGYPWLKGDQFDGIMNYQLTAACDGFFAEGTQSIRQFKNTVSRIRIQYTCQVNQVNLNLLDSHDTRRFLTKCGEDERKLLLALTFLLTYDGVPCIYYGTETGMKGGGDPDCRRCFDWNMEQCDMNIYRKIKRLLEIRNQFDCLRKGEFRWGESKQTICYERRYEEEKIVVVINNSTEQVILRPEKEWKGYVDLLTGKNLYGTTIIPEMSSMIIIEKHKEDKYI